MNSIVISPFNSGNSQAIRLPKAFAFPSNTRLIINKEGDKLTIEPVKTLEDVPSLFAKLGECMGDDLVNFERDEFEEIERDW